MFDSDFVCMYDLGIVSSNIHYILYSDYDRRRIMFLNLPEGHCRLGRCLIHDLAYVGQHDLRIKVLEIGQLSKLSLNIYIYILGVTRVNLVTRNTL